MYNYNFPRPSITCDCVVLRDIGFKEYEVLLIERGGDPYKGMLALPGGYMEQSERAIETAYRELYEETSPSIDNSVTTGYYNQEIPVPPIKITDLRFVGYYDSVHRHPYDRVINFAFSVVVSHDINFKAGDDAKKLVWIPALDVPKLAFDHNRILNEALMINRSANV